MIIVMAAQASPAHIDAVVAKIRAAGLSEHLSRGTERTIIGAVGDERVLSADMFETMPGVERAMRVLKDYRMAMPSEVIYAVERTIPWLKGILYTGRKYTGVRYWDKLEAYLREQSPLSCGSVAQN